MCPDYIIVCLPVLFPHTIHNNSNSLAIFVMFFFQKDNFKTNRIKRRFILMQMNGEIFKLTVFVSGLITI